MSHVNVILVPWYASLWLCVVVKLTLITANHTSLYQALPDCVEGTG